MAGSYPAPGPGDLGLGNIGLGCENLTGEGLGCRLGLVSLYETGTLAGESLLPLRLARLGRTLSSLVSKALNYQSIIKYRK